MKVRTNSLLQAAWFSLIGAIAFISILPSSVLSIPVLGPSIDRGWAHFVVYGGAATLCMLAWKSRTALPVAGGLFVLSIGFHFLHSLRSGIGMDSFAIVVNLLGIAAGVLLGLNLATLRSRMKNRVAVGEVPD